MKGASSQQKITLEAQNGLEYLMWTKAHIILRSYVVFSVYALFVALHLEPSEQTTTNGTDMVFFKPVYICIITVKVNSEKQRKIELIKYSI